MDDRARRHDGRAGNGRAAAARKPSLQVAERGRKLVTPKTQRDTSKKRLIVAMTGATGSIYGMRILEALRVCACRRSSRSRRSLRRSVASWMYRAAFWASRAFGLFLPPEEMVFERPQHAHFQRGHHDDERDRPCEHLIRLYEVCRLTQPISYTARRAERFSHERHPPSEAESE